MAHFLCHLGCSHFGALLLDFYFTENTLLVINVENGTLLTTLEFEKNVSDTGVVSETNKEK